MGGIPRPFRPVGIVSGETPGNLPHRMPVRRGLGRMPSRHAPGDTPHAPSTKKKPLRFVRSGHRENMTRGYFVTRSSQRTIESMTSIDMPQAATKTHHVAHIGVCM